MKEIKEMESVSELKRGDLIFFDQDDLNLFRIESVRSEEGEAKGYDAKTSESMQLLEHQYCLCNEKKLIPIFSVACGRGADRICFIAEKIFVVNNHV